MKSRTIVGLIGWVLAGALAASACGSGTDGGTAHVSTTQQSLVQQPDAGAFVGHPALLRASSDSRISPGVLSYLQSKAQVHVLVSFDVPELALPSALQYDHPNRALALSAIHAGANRLIGALPTQKVQRRFDSVNAIAIILDESALDTLRAQPGVTSVVLDQPGAGNLREAVPLSKLDVVQATGLTGAGVVVAVVDSGLDRTHPDLSDSLVGEACFCSGAATGDGVGCCPNGAETQTGSGAAADDNGHGTNVSGIVTSNGTVAPKGGAPGANIVVVKVLDSTNSFNFSSDVIAGYDWIITNRHDVKIVNSSLGTFALYPNACDANPDAGSWKTAVDTLRTNGVLLFASSGNQSSSTSMALPACVAHTIAVGAVWDSNVGSQSVFCADATTAADKITCFTNSDSALDLLAPGAPTTSTGLGGGTSTYYGTSQASPLAAACAALLLQSNSTLTADQLETALKVSATHITDARNGLSFPRLDCQSALASLGSCRHETDSAFCARLAKNCGSVTADDNCGTSRTVTSCGTCTSPATCAGAGTANVCGTSGGGGGALPRTGWTATASVTSGTDVVANALDGNTASRWSTGVHQTPGQSFTVDMKSAQTFNQLTLDSGGDFPRGYQVFVSSDGSSFGSAIATGAATGTPTTISFPTQSARYIKLVQTSNTSPSWWSIYELNVFAPASALSRTGWIASASASSGTDTPAKALDGLASTRFSTGAAQTSGQSFQVDMLGAKTFSKLTLDAGSSTGDYPHGYQVFVSSDGSSWGSAIASGTGATQVVTITFAARTARFVRVQLTASVSSNWWSIGEFNVFP